MKKYPLFVCFVMVATFLHADVTRGLKVSPLRQENRPGTGSAALFVGVNAFQDSQLNPLRYAVNDAVMQADLFVNQLQLVPAANTVLALSGEPVGVEKVEALRRLRAAGAVVVPARYMTILNTMESQVKKARGQADLLVIGISSHGFDEGSPYVAVEDTSMGNLKRTGLELKAFQEEMSRSRAGKRLLLLDACRNAPRRDNRSLGNPAMAGFLKALEAFRGEAVLASCKKDEMSYESAELGHGIFTHFLLEGLRGDAKTDEKGFITLGTLSEYVSENTSRWSRDHHNASQTPNFKDADVLAKSMPLAIPIERLRWDNRVNELKQLIAPKATLSGAFSYELLADMITFLETSGGSSEAVELVEAALKYSRGEMQERLFVAYLRGTVVTAPAPVPFAPAVISVPPALKEVMDLAGTALSEANPMKRGEASRAFMIAAEKLNEPWSQDPLVWVERAKVAVDQGLTLEARRAANELRKRAGEGHSSPGVRDALAALEASDLLKADAPMSVFYEDEKRLMPRLLEVIGRSTLALDKFPAAHSDTISKTIASIRSRGDRDLKDPHGQTLFAADRVLTSLRKATQSGERSPRIYETQIRFGETRMADHRIVEAWVQTNQGKESLMRFTQMKKGPNRGFQTGKAPWNHRATLENTLMRKLEEQRTWSASFAELEQSVRLLESAPLSSAFAPLTRRIQEYLANSRTDVQRVQNIRPAVQWENAWNTLLIP